MARFIAFVLLPIGWLIGPGTVPAFAQPDALIFSEVSGFPYPAPYSAYTARFDRSGRPVIYTANKEYGVIVFDFSNQADIKPVRSFSVQQFQNLKPTDLVQQGNYLYVSLGGFDGLITQSAGMAVLDVSDPGNTTLLGQWDSTAFNKGCAAVRVDGNYAYLGAMEKGVIILDVSDPAQPKYVAQLELDLNWPVPPGLFSVPHARGFALRGDDLWVCFDAGGLRRVDVSDKYHPVEKTKYLNPALDAAAQPAYNTAVIAGKHLFAAVDYCGFDVVDIGKPDQPVSVAWENPWNCTNTSWDGSPGHTNQLTTASHDSLLFLSGADTEVLAYSIADPEKPERVGEWAVLKDSIATWGLDVNDSLVVLAQIWNPLNTPFIAKKGGIRLLRWSYSQQTSLTPIAVQGELQIRVYPNPAKHSVEVMYTLHSAGAVRWAVYNALGSLLERGEGPAQEPGTHVTNVDLGTSPEGLLWLKIWVNGRVFSKKIMKIP